MNKTTIVNPPSRPENELDDDVCSNCDGILIDEVVKQLRNDSTAYAGYHGCDKTRDVENEHGGWDTVDIPPAECWGIQVGDKKGFWMRSSVVQATRSRVNTLV